MNFPFLSCHFLPSNIFSTHCIHPSSPKSNTKPLSHSAQLQILQLFPPNNPWETSHACMFPRQSRLQYFQLIPSILLCAHHIQIIANKTRNPIPIACPSQLKQLYIVVIFLSLFLTEVAYNLLWLLQSMLAMSTILLGIYSMDVFHMYAA